MSARRKYRTNAERQAAYRLRAMQPKLGAGRKPSRALDNPGVLAFVVDDILAQIERGGGKRKVRQRVANAVRYGAFRAADAARMAKWKPMPPNPKWPAVETDEEGCVRCGGHRSQRNESSGLRAFKTQAELVRGKQNDDVRTDKSDNRG